MPLPAGSRRGGTRPGHVWIIGAGLPMECEGRRPWDNEPRVAPVHTATIPAGRWMLRKHWMFSSDDNREVEVATKHCLQCGAYLELEAAAQRRGISLAELASRLTLVPRRDAAESRDLGHRSIGERALLSALLAGALRDLAGLDGPSRTERRRSLVWFESGQVGLVTFREVAAHLGLDAELLRRRALERARTFRER